MHNKIRKPALNSCSNLRNKKKLCDKKIKLYQLKLNVIVTPYKSSQTGIIQLALEQTIYLQATLDIMGN